jgi:DNA-binding response OmpR family regulator
MAAPLIGIANHDPTLIRLLDHVLTDAGFQTAQLPEGSAAYEEIKKRRPDLVVLDTWLETRESGWALLQVLLLDAETREIPVLICSSDRDEFERRAGTLEGHAHYGILNKPYDIDKLVEKIHEMLSRVEVRASKDGLKPE